MGQSASSNSAGPRRPSAERVPALSQIASMRPNGSGAASSRAGRARASAPASRCPCATGARFPPGRLNGADESGRTRKGRRPAPTPPDETRFCVLSSSRRQNRRYDFDTFGVSRADLFFYSRDLPSISAFSILLLAPPNSTSLPWCMMRSMMAEASLSSPNTTPHLLNSIFVVITRLRFS